MTLVPILLYHSIAEEPSAALRPFTVAPSAFRRHLETVVESGVTALSVSDFVRRRDEGTLPERPAVITFDDGFADFSEHVVPALAAHGLPCTLYVATGFLAGCPAPPARARPADATLHWSELVGIASSGIELGAHTHGHPHLDTLAAKGARVEIERSKALLENALGRPVESFAYPHGYSGPAVRRLVREAGFSSACAVGNTFSSTTDDPFALARLTVRNTTATEELAQWLRGAGAPPPRVRERVRTRAWRAYRRTRAVATGVAGSDFY